MNKRHLIKFIANGKQLNIFGNWGATLISLARQSGHLWRVLKKEKYQLVCNV